MVADVVAAHPVLFLGSRLKRLGERMQADVQRIVEAADLPVQPAHYPLLVALDTYGDLSVGDLVVATGVSQPGVTRNLTRLLEMGLVGSVAPGRDRRRKRVALTPAGTELVARSRREVWPRVQDAAAELCGGDAAALLARLDAMEAALDQEPLSQRAVRLSPPGLKILEWSEDRATAFHDINAEWIRAMFVLEDTDREVLENPRARIIEPGGDILFVEAEGLGVVGACALQKTGEGRFELTKMGVRETARGRKAGEFLLRAMIRRAHEKGGRTLYLLTNARCAPAIHLYEKAGFAHDAEIMRDHGARYERCDVAMRYVGPSMALPRPGTAA